MAEPSDYLPVSACPILCDADCEVDCHAQHIPMFQRQRAKREGWPLDAGHMVEDCPSQRAADPCVTCGDYTEWAHNDSL